MDNNIKDSIDAFIASNPTWKYQDNTLIANYEFADFQDAMKVVNEVARVAKEQQHHPFWSNEYNKLGFVLSTHDAGGKVTEKDMALAEAIVAVVNNMR
jgi:4a-hydroxytetrahydrobiopterin dehydratase